MIRDKSDKGFNSNQAKQERTSFEVCERHKQPLVIFCNNPECQKSVCQTCVLLKHKDHDVMEIAEKFEELNEDTKDIEQNVSKASKVYNAITEKIEQEKNTISRTTSDALEKIEKTKKKLIARIEKEAEEQTKNVIDIQEKQLSSFEETLCVITAKQQRLMETRSLITDLTSENNIQKAMTMQAAIKPHYTAGLSNRKEMENLVKQYDTVIFEEASKIIEEQNILGNVATKQHEFEYPFLGAISCASVGREILQSNGRGETNAVYRRTATSTILQKKKITAVNVKSWQSKRACHTLSCSPTGIIYTATHNDEIQAFDLNGVLKMEEDVTDGIQGITGMTCCHHNDKDMLVLALLDKRIQLRDGRNGSLVDEQRIAGFRPRWSLCQDSPGTVLISGEMGKQWMIIECDINNNRITERHYKTMVISTDLDSISYITSCRKNNRKIVVATCGYYGYEQAIVAVDYENGHQLWKICEPTFNGRDIKPERICSDGGDYLFVADWNNSRVIVMDTQGEMKQEICTDIDGICWDVICIPGRNKLIVSDNKKNIYVYDIMYQD